MRRFAFAALSMLAVTGCTTGTVLREPPPAKPSASTACGDADAEPAVPPTAGAEEICRVTQAVVARSNTYIAAFNANSNVRATAQGMTLVSALAGAGFLVFDAHPDNIKAAGLSAGAFSLIDGGLKLNERVDVMHDGAASMACYASVGNTFAAAYGRRLTIDARSLSEPEELARVTDELNSNIALARRHMLDRTPPAKKEPETEVEAAAREAAQLRRDRLTETVRVATETYEVVVKARTAFSSAASEIEQGAAEADSLVFNRLRGIRPDISALVTQAQAIATKLNKPATTPTAPATEAEGQHALTISGIPDTDDGWNARLEGFIQRAERLDAARYVSAYERIGACKAIAAS